ncbi:MAG: alanine racemase [Flammeovirgaceae bacterium]|jgi:alanine racemase
MNLEQTSQFWQKRFLLTDSRQLIHAPSTLFFAIRGARHDGHEFIKSLYQKGVRYFVVERDVDSVGLENANFVKVDYAIEALQQLVSLHRKKFTFPIIGITGSNGKTIVKEWLFELLEPNFSCVKSPKSYNSQIGVPLSVWEMREGHNLGIFEAGISKPAEMEKLEKVIQPTIGIFTNIGTAHQEGFENQRQKIREKLKLFVNSELLVYCANHSEIAEEIRLELANGELGCELLSWGNSEDSDLQIREAENTSFLKSEPTRTWDLRFVRTEVLTSTVSTLEPNKIGNSKVFNCQFQNQNFTLQLPFSDSASVENAFHCVAVLLHFGVSPMVIQERISQLQNIPMRLELKQGIGNCLLVNDTYNNDLGGLAIALDFLAQQDDSKTRTVILSDLLESGTPPETLYREVNLLLKSKKIERFFGIGEQVSRFQDVFEIEEKSFFPNTNSFLSAIPTFQNEILLIKGARNFHLEEVANRLQQKVHGTRLEVNLDALQHNLNFYKSLLQPETKLMVMVKAFAYGSGSYEVAKLLQYNRVDYLAVAYTDEGVELREKGIRTPIMVMNPAPETFGKLIQHQLEPEIYSERIFQQFGEFVRSEGISSFPIHLEFDTGMRRLGFEESNLPKLQQLISDFPELRIVAGFTHLAGSDEGTHNSFSERQLELFTSLAGKLEEILGYKIIKHALNSSGIVRFPNSHFDMVRLGIGLYGVETNGKFQNQLRNVATLKTTISQIRTIQKGESIGYSRKWILKRDSKIGVLAIGYADGFDRGFSNGIGKVIVNGKAAPIVGNVCMDMCMVDLTGIEVQEEDEAIIFGAEISLSEMAKSIGTISYELLTNVSERVKRVFYKE